MWHKTNDNWLQIINAFLVVSLFISINVLSISIGLYVGISVILFFSVKDELKPYLIKEWKLFFLISLPLLIILISLIWSENIIIGLDQVFKRIPLILLPFSFWVQRFFLKKNFKKRILIFYVLCCTLFSLYGFLSIYLFYPINYKTHLTFIHLRYLLENHILHMHPVYLGLSWGLASVVAFYYTIEQRKNKITYRLLYFCAFGINFCAMVFISARMSIVTTLICISILLLTLKRYKFTLVLGVLVIGAIAYIQKSLPGFRFNEVSEMISKGSLNSLKDGNTLNTRLQIYTCALGFFESHPVFGYGIGDIKNLMFSCTKDSLGEFKYNSHNQYIEFMISSGIVGLSFFLAFLLHLCRSLYLRRNVLGIVLFVFFILSFLTENLFARTRGVFIFTYIIYLFYFFYDTEEKTKNYCELQVFNTKNNRGPKVCDRNM